MKSTKIIPSFDQQMVHETMNAEDQRTTTIKFEDNEFVFFEPTKGGMQAVVKGQLLEPYNGGYFNEDFVTYLRDNGVSGFVEDRLYDAVGEALRKALVMEAVMKCMK